MLTVSSMKPHLVFLAGKATARMANFLFICVSAMVLLISSCSILAGILIYVCFIRSIIFISIMTRFD